MKLTNYLDTSILKLTFYRHEIVGNGHCLFRWAVFYKVVQTLRSQLTFLQALVSRVTCNNEFAYLGENGPDEWAHEFPGCSGLRQSPININTHETKKILAKRPLKLERYDKPLSGSVVNNGHSIQFTPSNSELPVLSGGFLPKGERFQFSQLHFHWGSETTKGSEHTLNGIRFVKLLSKQPFWKKNFKPKSESLFLEKGAKHFLKLIVLHKRAN